MGIRVVLIGFVLTVIGLNSSAMACPFCSAVSQTLRQEITSMDTAVIAEAVEQIGDPNEGKLKLRIVHVLKGPELAKVGTEIEAAYFGKVTLKRHFMLTGVDPPKIMWSSPLAVTERSEKYLQQILNLPEDPIERLKFYQDFLEDEDPMLARDAYDEFAVAPYAEVKALGPHMAHDKLIRWIEDSEIAADRKRLYFTMLGVCGNDKDIPMLETMLTSTQSSARAGLDALIACYLCLKGPSGLELIDREFLSSKKTEYSHTYSAIQALRFHGTETEIIPKNRLVASLALILERKDLADLVIPDLARWEDWSQIDRMVTLFKEADANDNFVRVPIVNYLRACPKPEAKAALEEVEKIDPVAVRRANTFFPAPNPVSPPKPTTSGIGVPPVNSGIGRGIGVPPVNALTFTKNTPTDRKQLAQNINQQEMGLKGDRREAYATGSVTDRRDAYPTAYSTADRRDAYPTAYPTMNPFSILAVLASAGSSLMIVFWLVLVG